MSMKRNYNFGRKKRNNRQTHAKKVREIAYLMGCVERGRKNPESLISASYNKGKNYAETTSKSLY